MLLALDRSSVRTFDDDGHLHVSTANISKATVNPYLAEEIPGWKELGLEKGRVYKLLRDPKELEKAAPTFTGKPLLIKHTPVGAEDHPHEKVVGAVGPVKYEHPYLKAPLHIWPGDAIDKIKSGKQQQISCGYRYTPSMEPGTYEGEHFDGRMKDIVGNHIALVEEGRAGPSCVIGDSALRNQTSDSTEQLNMKTKPLDRKAAMEATFSPATINAAKTLLAQDADLADLAKLLDAFSGPPAGGEAEPEVEDDAPVLDPNAAAAPMGAEGDKPAVTDADEPDASDPDASADPDAGKGDDDGDAIAQARTFLASKLSPEDLNTFNSLVAKIGGEEAPTEDEEDPAAVDPVDPGAVADPNATETAIPPAGEKKPGAQDEDEDMIPKSAMDAAVAARAKPMIAAALAAHDAATKATFAAKDAVEKALGKVVACDSATDYYRLGLKSFDVEGVDALPASALKATFDAVAKGRAAAPRAKPAIAQDASADAEYAKRFPNAGRLAR